MRAFSVSSQITLACVDMFGCPKIDASLYFCILGGDGENEENEGMSDDDENASGSDD